MEREERSHVKQEREEDRDYRHNERVRVKQERPDRHDRPHRQREDQQRERRQNDDRRRQNHRQRGNNPFRTTEEDGLEFGRPGDSNDKNKGKPVEKEKPNFGTSGKLAEDTNIYRGVVIKYNQPPEARKPKTRWRLYPFKGDEAFSKTFFFQIKFKFTVSSSIDHWNPTSTSGGHMSGTCWNFRNFEF